ncbi:MAG: hypothetical protein LBI49_03500, partial [Nocardiopsaceae bacterium]|nr:hypothetical protein [Nocardiopsaceae bacterium]
MNGVERMVDGIDPELSARLRALKLRLRHRVVWRLVRDLTGPGDVAVDLGANRGVYTYLMSVMVGRAGRVHAVEPFPANCHPEYYIDRCSFHKFHFQEYRYIALFPYICSPPQDQCLLY